jgi:hypothetical protein
MIKQFRYLNVAGLLVFTSFGFAQQYTMDLTGVGDGLSVGGAYVGPYQGTISENGNQIYSGYMICDDFYTESYLDDPWTATSTNAGGLNGTEKFTTSDTKYTVQQNYDAVAWLANQLVANPTNPIVQINYSFAIWDIMDGEASNPLGGTTTLITNAFAAVNSGYVASNVTVFTPSPNLGISQEFLVVSGPKVATPEPAGAAMIGFDLLSALAGIFLLRRYRVRCRVFHSATGL